MSIYNGFVNHDQEIRYYQLIKYLVLALEKRLIKFYRGEECDEDKFVKLMKKIKYKITKMEKSKYSEPKFDDSIDTLLKLISPSFEGLNSNISMRSFQQTRFQSSYSNFSMGFSVAKDPTIITKKDTEPIKDYSGQISERRKRYKSLQKIKNQPIIEVIQTEDSQKWRRRFSGLKVPQRPSIPKIQSFVKNVQKESEAMISSDKKHKLFKDIQSYLGQRRKKSKKHVRKAMPFY